MTTKENMLTSISKEIEQEFGKPGTPERAKFDEEAFAFYTGQVALGCTKRGQGDAGGIGETATFHQVLYIERRTWGDHSQCCHVLSYD